MIKKIICDMRQNGINNISGDIIFAYPNQTKKMFKYDLKCLVKLKLNHISAYDLIIEEQTRLNYLINKRLIKLEDEDKSYHYYKLLIKTLKRNRYNQYEISSFARNKQYGVHNLKYWHSMEYVAIGFGATSFYDGCERVNSTTLNEFYENIQQVTILSSLDLKQRYLLMGLRKLAGISLTLYQQQFDSQVLSDFPNLQNAIDIKLLKIENNYLKLTKKGVFLANQVFAECI